MSIPSCQVSLRAAVSLILALTLVAGACSTDDGDRDGADQTSSTPTTISPTSPTGPVTTLSPLGQPTPTFEALSNAFTYGDDPALDELWDACAGGSGQACDDLYYAAPTDSEYENFGYTCGDRNNVLICTELDVEPGVTPPTR
jgi:hypothetical protein